jgi:hypothetical protein
MNSNCSQFQVVQSYYNVCWANNDIASELSKIFSDDIIFSYSSTNPDDRMYLNGKDNVIDEFYVNLWNSVADRSSTHINDMALTGIGDGNFMVEYDIVQYQLVEANTWKNINYKFREILEIKDGKIVSIDFNRKYKHILD